MAVPKWFTSWFSELLKLYVNDWLLGNNKARKS